MPTICSHRARRRNGGPTPADHQGAADIVVIGAGPAGLAVGACLTRAGIPCVILEQSAKPAAAWRRHYDRLHLHTSKAHSELPFLGFPTNYPRYPSRLQLIEYLERYARHFRLNIEFEQRVTAARPARGGWDVETERARYLARHLVVATGHAREPYRPEWPGQSSFRGSMLHSSDYRNGAGFTGQRVLVVGLGNSGGEIALDLHEHGGRASLSVRSPVNVIPRDLLGVPIIALGIAQRGLPARVADRLNAPILRAAVGDLTRYGLPKPSRGPLEQIQHDGRIPLIDVGIVRLLKRGEVRVHPGIERFTETGVVFTNGHRQDCDAIILATGYRPRVDAFLRGASAAHDEHGTPGSSGCEAPLAGLYFCGYRVSATGMLREIALEARRIAAAIAARSGLFTALISKGGRSPPCPRAP